MIAHSPPRRSSLVTALSACAESALRARARRFLLGLSSDELEFIAGFVGTCILKSAEEATGEASPMEAGDVGGSGAGRSDLEHKLILLREFLQCSRRQMTPGRGAGPAAA